MPKEAKLKVSKRDGPSFTVMFNEPENLDDPRWKDLLADPKSEINKLAVSALRVRVQAVARDSLDKGEEAVQKAVNEYNYESKARSAKAAPTLSKKAAKDGKFSAAQLAMLAEAGFDIEPSES